FFGQNEFGVRILQQVEDSLVKRIIFLNGSNRASLREDLYNRIHNFDTVGGFDTGSAFKFLKDFTEAVHKSLEAPNPDVRKIVHDPRTMSDIWNPDNPTTQTLLESESKGIDYPIGFINDKTELEQHKKHLHQHTAHNQSFDHSKISLLYAKIHALALEHPNEKIVFEHYDDNADICNALYYAFSTYPQLLPSNVELRIYHFDLTVPEGRPVMDVLLNTAPQINSHTDSDPKRSSKGDPIIGTGGKPNPAFAIDAKKLHAACKTYLLTQSDYSKLDWKKAINNAVNNFFTIEHKLSKTEIVPKKVIPQKPPEEIFHFDQLRTKILDDLENYLTSGGSYVKNKLLTHRSDAIKLTKQILNEKEMFSTQIMFNNLLPMMLNEWGKGLQKHAAQLTSSAHQDEAMILFLARNTQSRLSYFHHIYNGLQFMAAAYQKHPELKTNK